MMGEITRFISCSHIICFWHTAHCNKRRVVCTNATYAGVHVVAACIYLVYVYEPILMSNCQPATDAGEAHANTRRSTFHKHDRHLHFR